MSVVGDLPELGAWDAYTSALQLHTGSACYPLWATLTPRQIEVGLLEGSNLTSPRAAREESSNDIGVESETPEEVREQTPEDVGADGWTSPRLPPQGAGRGSLGFGRAVIHVQYKYVKDRRKLRDNGPSILWESSIANRSVAIPLEPGSVWMVSDAKFNDSREPTKLTRTTLIEILARQGALGVACSSRSHQRLADSAPEWTGREQEEDCSSHASGLTNESHHTTSTIGMFGNLVSN